MLFSKKKSNLVPTYLSFAVAALIGSGLTLYSDSASAFFGGGGPVGCQCTAQIAGNAATISSAIGGQTTAIIASDYFLAEMNNFHRFTTQSMSDKKAEERHLNLLTYMAVLEEKQAEFMSRIALGNQFAGIPDPSDPAYHNPTNSPATACVQAVSTRGGSTSMTNYAANRDAITQSVSAHIDEPEPLAVTTARRSLSAPVLLDSRTMLAPDGQIISPDMAELTTTHIQALTDFNPVQPVNPEHFKSPVDPEVAAAIKDRQMRLKSASNYFEHVMGKNLATRPVNPAIEHKFAESSFPGKDAMERGIVASGNMISERARLTLDVHYTDSLAYQTNLNGESTGTDELLRELINATNLNSRVQLAMLDEQEKANLAMITRTAQEIDHSTRPIINELRVRSSSFVIPTE